MIHIPSYNDYLNEQDLLLETGEIVTPYKWKFVDIKRGSYNYKFTGMDNLGYECWFQPEGAPSSNAYEIKFTTEGATNGDKADLTNKGDAIKVVSTVIDILKDFMVRVKYLNFLIAIGSPTEEEKAKGINPTKRSKLYYIMLEKNKKEIFGKKMPKDIEFNRRASEIFITF